MSHYPALKGAILAVGALAISGIMLTGASTVYSIASATPAQWDEIVATTLIKSPEVKALAFDLAHKDRIDRLNLPKDKAEAVVTPEKK